MNLYVYVGNDPVNGIDPEGMLNVTKMTVGIINLIRAGKAGISGGTGAIITAVAVGSGVGLPLGVVGTAVTGYQLLVAFPGLSKRGVQQFDEALAECPDGICFGHWRNLLGLGPLGQYVDDACEPYHDEVAKQKLEHFKEIASKASEEPVEALNKFVEWLQDWAM